MKKSLFSVLVTITALVTFSVTSCKKDDNNNDADYTSDFTVQTDEHNFVASEGDNAATDASLVLENDLTFAGRGTSVICGATLTPGTTATSRTMTITYNGNNCTGTRKRVGEIVLSILKTKKWKDAGTVLTINYNNLKITRLYDNKSIVLNGTETVTNTSGGTWITLSSAPVVHDIASNNLSIKFDDGTQRTWEVSKKRTYTYDNGIVISEIGTHSDGTNNDIAEWGTNRLGKTFSARIVSPLTVRQDCDFRLTGGQIIYSKLIVPVTVTFGLNSSGAATSCPGASASYYLKVEWSGLGGTPHSFVAPY